MNTQSQDQTSELIGFSDVLSRAARSPHWDVALIKRKIRLGHVWLRRKCSEPMVRWFGCYSSSLVHIQAYIEVRQSQQSLSSLLLMLAAAGGCWSGPGSFMFFAFADNCSLHRS